MSLRCGCPAEGDETVFGPVHECTAPKPPLDPPALVPSWVFTVPAGEPAERPFETTLSDGDGDRG